MRYAVMAYEDEGDSALAELKLRQKDVYQCIIK